jgi:hypothetical protein
VNCIETPLGISNFEGFFVSGVALVDLDLAALVADSFEDFLDFANKPYIKLARDSTSHTECSHTNVKDGSHEFNVTEMTRAFLHALHAGSTLKGTIDGAKTRVTKARGARFLLCFILLHVNYEVSF